MPVYLPELKQATPAGLYAISPSPPSRKKTSFKVGRTTNFAKRLNDYHICFNDGYYIYCILPLNNKVYEGKPAAEKLAMTRRLEKEMFDLLEPYMELRETRSRKSEWYGLKQTDLAEKFQKIHEKFPEQTLPPIVEWEDAHVRFNEEGEQILSQKLRKKRGKRKTKDWEKHHLDTFKSNQFGWS